MEDKKELLSFMIYIWNRWCKEECAIVFNGKNDVDEPSWTFSLGEHIWNKWMTNYQYLGTSTGCAERLVAELSEDNLQKIIDRACSLYYGRVNRK